MVRQLNSCVASILGSLQYLCIGDLGCWTACNYTILGNATGYVWGLKCLDIGMFTVFETIILASPGMVPMGGQSSGQVHLPLQKPMVSHWFWHTSFRHTGFESYLAPPTISFKSTIFRYPNIQVFYSSWRLNLLMFQIIHNYTCQHCNTRRSYHPGIANIAMFAYIKYQIIGACQCPDICNIHMTQYVNIQILQIYQYTGIDIFQYSEYPNIATSQYSNTRRYQ